MSPISSLKKRLPISFYATGAVLVLSLLLPLPRGGTIAHLPSVCPFFNATGLPCPGCGLTRSFVCLAHGHLFEALRWHPLGPVLFGGALVFLAGTLLKWRWPSEKWVMISLVAALFVFWGLRLGGVFPMPA